MAERESRQAQIAWEVWYSDTFDRDSPSSVDAKGVGLAKGLAHLWARHLFETVQPNGAAGFSRFFLKWQGGRVDISGSTLGEKRLRAWLFGDNRESLDGYADTANGQLLATIAAVHMRKLDRPTAASEILAVAETAANAEEFAERLAQ